MALRPSAAHRWSVCAKSVDYDDVVDKDPPYRLEGKIAHKLAEECIAAGCTAQEYYDVRSKKVLVDDVVRDVPENMPESVDLYLADIRALASGCAVQQEVKLDTIECCDNGGTVDAYCLALTELQIHDLKYGRREVSAEKNDQMILYAAGLIDFISGLIRELPDEFTVRMFIHLPLIRRIDEWATTVAGIKAEYARLSERALAIKAGCRDAVPGEKQCFYCKGKAECIPLREYLEAETVGDFENVADEIKAVQQYDADRLGRSLASLELLGKWADAVQDFARAELLQGRAVPGWKIVQGKAGNRAWTDSAAAERRMARIAKLKKAQRYKLSLISPTELEKRVEEEVYKKFEGIISRAEGKPVLAKVSDKRPALEISNVADEFKDLTKTEEDEV